MTPCVQAKCGVCFEDHLEANMRSTGCRHMFCKDCWRGYISASVEAGPGVLDLRCPLPDCSAAVRTAVHLCAFASRYPDGPAACKSPCQQSCMLTTYARRHVIWRLTSHDQTEHIRSIREPASSYDCGEVLRCRRK